MPVPWVCIPAHLLWFHDFIVIANMIKKTYHVKGMHCSSCPLLIEGELEDIGVKAKCKYATGALDVEYDEAKLNENAIRAAVKSAGYELLQ